MKPVRLLFLWHFHQPDYTDPESGRQVLPWVSAHSLRHYSTMLEIAKKHKGIAQNFSVTPVLLDQVLRIARNPVLDPLFARLVSRNRTKSQEAVREIRKWLGPFFAESSVARKDALNPSDLLSLAPHILSSIIEHLSALWNESVVEVVGCPYYHPVLPLLCDRRGVEACTPKVRLPEVIGSLTEDAREQISRSVDRHKGVLGRAPKAVWCPEGGLSPKTLEIVAEAKFILTFGDERLLPQGFKPDRLYAYQGLHLIFRDTELSDLIGFKYRNMTPEEASDDLIRRVLERAKRSEKDEPLICIALDGENPWTLYPDAGAGFLTRVFARIEELGIETLKAEDAVQRCPPAEELPNVRSGSWVDGTFYTWLDSPQAIKAWQLLGGARAICKDDLPREMLSAEGSDWFWWFGGRHDAPEVGEFDSQFRRLLGRVYEHCGGSCPRDLECPILVRTLRVPLAGTRRSMGSERASRQRLVLAGGAMASSSQTVEAELKLARDGRGVFGSLIVKPSPSVVRAVELSVGGKRMRARRTDMGWTVSGDGSVREHGVLQFRLVLPGRALECAAPSDDYFELRYGEEGEESIARFRLEVDSEEVTMPELRKDPVIGRWVIIASERARRPSDFPPPAVEEETGKRFCPFCEGNEAKTPPEVYAVRPADTPRDGPGWRVRVVPNRYPALRIEGDLDKRGKGMYDMMNGVGAHEVLIESPKDATSLTELPEEQVKLALLAARTRLLDLKRDVRFEYVVLFKNVGRSAGASIRHTHSQLIALPVVPRTVANEMQGSLDYFRFRGRCIFCDMIEQEDMEAERVVLSTDSFLVFCPFASRFPMEMWIVPRNHYTHFEESPEEVFEELAGALQSALRSLESVIKGVNYNYIVHTTPFRVGKPEHYHWHIEIIPRLTEVAGFEWGTGFYMNPMLPEDAAYFLRKGSE